MRAATRLPRARSSRSKTRRHQSWRESPAAVTIECGTAEPTDLPTARDVCDTTPAITVVSTTAAGACVGQSIVTRVFTATDACGNTSTASQVVTIEDTTAPVMAGVPAAVTIECGTAEPTALPTATDVCDAAPVVTVASTTTAGACAGESIVTRVFTATDACGNTSTASQVVTIEDTTAPVMAGVPAAVTIECGTAEPTALPTASDVCDAAPVVTVASTTTAGACAGRVDRDAGLHGDRRVWQYIDRQPGRHDRGHDCSGPGEHSCRRHDRVRHRRADRPPDRERRLRRGSRQSQS